MVFPTYLISHRNRKKTKLNVRICVHTRAAKEYKNIPEYLPVRPAESLPIKRRASAIRHMSYNRNQLVQNRQPTTSPSIQNLRVLVVISLDWETTQQQQQKNNTSHETSIFTTSLWFSTCAPIVNISTTTSVNFVQS